VIVDYCGESSNDKNVALDIMMEEEHDARELETGSRLLEMENWA
jgi:hypothetical protein